MQVANIEYTDQAYTLKLFGISLLVFVVLMILLIGTEIIGVMGGIVVAFIVPVAIFWFGKGKITKKGSVVINDSYSDFKLEQEEAKIMYSEIATYHIEHFRGARLVVKFKNGKKFKLVANANFSNPLNLGAVLDALDKALQAYKAANNIAIERKPSIFERKWMLPLLIVATTGVVIAIVVAISEGEPLQTPFYSSTVFLIVLWVGWVAARKGKK